MPRTAPAPSSPHPAADGGGRRRVRLRRALAGLFAGVAVVALVAVGVNATVERAGLRATALDRAALLADAIAADVAAGQEVARTYLRVLASDPGVLAGDVERCEALAAQLASIAGRSFGAVGLDGRAWCLEPNEPAPTYADREWFQVVTADPRPYKSEFIVGRTSGVASVVLVEPLFRDGALVSLATSGWALTQLVATIDLTPYPVGTTVDVVDRNGLVLAQVPSERSPVGEALPEDDPVAAVLARTAAAAPVVRRGADGVARLFHASELASGLRVVVGWPTAAVYAAADRRALANAALLAALLALAFTWVGWRVRRELLDPLSALGRAMDQVGAGATGVRVGRIRGPAELVAIGEAFDATARALGERTAELAEEVRERARREDQLRQILRHSPMPITLLDRDGRYVEIGDAALEMVGRPRDQVLGRPATDFQDPALHEAWRARIAQVLDEGRVLSVHDQLPDRASGTPRTFETLLFPVLGADGTAAGVGAIAHDVTDRLAATAELDRLAHVDPLTRVANRRALVTFLDLLLPAAQRSGELVVVGYIDLDGFKAINDGYGHAVGDAVLSEVAERLTAGVRAGDLVARLGGDEFAFVLRGVNGEADARETAERLSRALAAPLASASGPTRLTASIGLALFPSCGPDADALLRGADQAMYVAKRSRDGSVRFAREAAASGG